MRSIERAAIIVDIKILLVNCCTPLKYIGLYNATNQFFVLPVLNKKIRYNSIVWKTYHNNPLKIKGVLVEEKYTT